MLQKPYMNDLGAVVGKALLGGAAAAVAINHPLLAVFAPLLQEAVSSIIPSRRIDRIEKMVTVLGQRLAQSNADQYLVSQRLTSDKFLGLLESSFQQAARATSEVRLRYIASMLYHGLTTEEIDALMEERLLNLLGEINDAEFLILLQKAGVISEQRFAELNDGYFPLARMYARNSEEDRHHDLYENLIAHLVNIGLLHPKYMAGPADMGFVRHDNREPKSYYVSDLGLELIRRMDENDIIRQQDRLLDTKSKN